MLKGEVENKIQLEKKNTNLKNKKKIWYKSLNEIKWEGQNSREKSI
jgi:hypothetical protein